MYLHNETEATLMIHCISKKVYHSVEPYPLDVDWLTNIDSHHRLLIGKHILIVITKAQTKTTREHPVINVF